MSAKNKNIIVAILLLVMYPAGIIMMLIWREKWYTWVRVILFLPFILALLGIIYFVIFWKINSKRGVESAKNAQGWVECRKACYSLSTNKQVNCLANCK